MEDLLSGSGEVTWGTESIESKDAFIAAVLKAQCYRKLGKKERGVVRQFLRKVTAASRAQITRLIGRWMQNRKIVRQPVQRPSFTVRYQREDVVLWAATDAAHEDLAGPALRRILYREFTVFGKPEYARLAGISVSHLYNLRHSQTYENQRVRVQHTQSRQVAIGERRKPDPLGQPGYLRVDTHGAPRTEGWQGGRLSHQCRRHGDAMAERRLRGDDQRAAHVARTGSNATPVPVSHHGISLQQRLGVS